MNFLPTRMALILLVFVLLCATRGGANADTITDALSAAYLSNPDLKAAGEALNVTNEQRPQALAGWLPTIQITQGATQQNYSPPGRFGPGYRLRDTPTSVQIVQPITRGGSEFARLRAAEDNIRAQRAALLSAEQTVLFNAASAYLSLWANTKILQYRTVNRDALRHLVSAIEQLVAVGDRTLADQALAQARLAQADANVDLARTAVDQARAVYLQVIGTVPGSLATPRSLSGMPPRLQDMVSVAQLSNPSVVSAYYADKAAAEQVKVQIGALLPSLSVQANTTQDRYDYDPSGRNGLYTTANMTLQLTVPLYQGGAEYSAVRAAKKTELQLRYQLDSARTQAISTVQQTWAQREGNQAALSGLTTQVRAMTVAVDQYQRELAAGLRTILEVVDGYQDQVNAQIQLVQTQQSRIQNDYALLQSVGGLTARSLALPVQYYDPTGDYKRTKWRIFGLSVNQDD